jgi:hypothetical protein
MGGGNHHGGGHHQGGLRGQSNHGGSMAAPADKKDSVVVKKVDITAAETSKAEWAEILVDITEEADLAAVPVDSREALGAVQAAVIAAEV